MDFPPFFIHFYEFLYSLFLRDFSKFLAARARAEIFQNLLILEKTYFQFPIGRTGK